MTFSGDITSINRIGDGLTRNTCLAASFRQRGDVLQFSEMSWIGFVRHKLIMLTNVSIIIHQF